MISYCCILLLEMQLTCLYLDKNYFSYSWFLTRMSSSREVLKYIHIFVSNCTLNMQLRMLLFTCCSRILWYLSHIIITQRNYSDCPRLCNALCVWLSMWIRSIQNEPQHFWWLALNPTIYLVFSLTRRHNH